MPSEHLPDKIYLVNWAKEDECSVSVCACVCGREYMYACSYDKRRVFSIRHTMSNKTSKYNYSMEYVIAAIIDVFGSRVSRWAWINGLCDCRLHFIPFGIFLLLPIYRQSNGEQSKGSEERNSDMTVHIGKMKRASKCCVYSTFIIDLFEELKNQRVLAIFFQLKHNVNNQSRQVITGYVQLAQIRRFALLFIHIVWLLNLNVWIKEQTVKSVMQWS